jgi:hypothetical protein
MKYLCLLLTTWLFATAAVAHDTAMHQKTALATSVAFAPDGALWMIGLNANKQLAIRQSSDDGISWREERVLEIGADVVAADGENRPKIIFGPNDTVVVTYTQPLAKPYTGEIRMLRSTDGGRTFSSPFTVHHDRHIITHRFESAAFDAQGTLHVLWIDKRDAIPGYDGAAVYQTVSRDGGATFGPDGKVADHSCECCRIALAPDGNGDIVALWRHVYPGNIRDHAFARLRVSSAETTPPVRATFDDWHLEACPHHGPDLAPAASGGFHAVWFGIDQQTAGVRYVHLDTDGKQTSAPRVIPDRRAEHAVVAASGKDVVILWRSFDGTKTRLSAWSSKDDGRSFKMRVLNSTSGDSDHPQLVQQANRIFAFWRRADGVYVERLTP